MYQLLHVNVYFKRIYSSSNSEGGKRHSWHIDFHFFLSIVICGLSFLRHFGREDWHPDSLLISFWEATTGLVFWTRMSLRLQYYWENRCRKLWAIMTNINLSDQLVLIEKGFAKVYQIILRRFYCWNLTRIDYSFLGLILHFLCTSGNQVLTKQTKRALL